MPGLETEFTDKNISPWGGLRFVEELYRKTGLRDFLEEIQTELPQPQSNRGYSPIDLMEGFIVGVILGANRLAHAGALRNDQVIRRIFGWNKGMASQSTFSRFFNKFDRERNDKVFTQINHYWFSRLKINQITLDFDSTVITRYGSQEGVAKGYNPTRKGRGSHHPLLAMVAETQMIANAWMRTGDSSSGTDFLDFYEETKQIVKPERIGLVRADKGFCSEKIMAQWEKDKLSFIMPVAMTSPIVRRIFELDAWMPFDKGYWSGQFQYKAMGWSKSRRIVVIRRERENDRQNRGKLLFPEIEEFEKYTYAAFVTNVNYSDELVWRLYNMRADCENRIKELKNDYGIEGFCMESFYATEAAFRLAMIAHNLMALFRLQALNNRHLPTLSTIRFQCIAIGSYLIRKTRKTKLKLSAKEKRRDFLEQLFQKITSLVNPFELSIA